MRGRFYSADSMEYKQNRRYSDLVDFHHVMLKYKKEQLHIPQEGKDELYENKCSSFFSRNNVKYKHEYVEPFQIDNTCSMDIGGTLIKCVYVSNKCLCEHNEGVNDSNLEIQIGENKYLFLKFFRVHELENALNFFTTNILIKTKLVLTGGGAYKYFLTVLEHLLCFKLLQKTKRATLTPNSKAPFLSTDYIKDVLRSVCVSRKHFCETLGILQVQIYIHNEENIESEKLLSKQICFDLFRCKVIKIYFSNEDCLPKPGKHRSEDEVGVNKEMGQAFLEDDFLLELDKKDEMQSIINGIYILFNVTKSIVKYNFFMESEIFANLKFPVCPFLLVNMGSGVSILKSDRFGECKRIIGTAIGGGTFMGIAQLILGEISYPELIKLAEKGGNDLDLQLESWKRGKEKNKNYYDANFLFSSLGSVTKILRKMKKRKSENEMIQFRQNIAKSLIQIISFNIAQSAYMLAVAHNVHRIFFSGKYVNNCELIMKLITWGVCYTHYSRSYNMPNRTKHKSILADPYAKKKFHFLYRSETSGNGKFIQLVEHSNTCSFCNEDSEMETAEGRYMPEVLFLKHDGYIGAIGCFFS